MPDAAAAGAANPNQPAPKIPDSPSQALRTPDVQKREVQVQAAASEPHAHVSGRTGGVLGAALAVKGLADSLNSDDKKKDGLATATQVTGVASASAGVVQSSANVASLAFKAGTASTALATTEAIAGKLGVIGAVGVGALVTADGIRKGDKKEVAEGVGGTAGALAGAEAGAALGAVVGSAVPVVGTAIGGIVGGVVGGIAGSKAGSYIAEKAVDVAAEAGKTASNAYDYLASALSGDTLAKVKNLGMSMLQTGTTDTSSQQKDAAPSAPAMVAPKPEGTQNLRS